MSSMRNAVQRRNHKERGQPEERAKWGLLEKRKVSASIEISNPTLTNSCRTINSVQPTIAKRRSVSRFSKRKPRIETLMSSPSA
jgi:hypothetical protein